MQTGVPAYSVMHISWSVTMRISRTRWGRKRRWTFCDLERKGKATPGAYQLKKTYAQLGKASPEKCLCRTRFRQRPFPPVLARRCEMGSNDWCVQNIKGDLGVPQKSENNHQAAQEPATAANTIVQIHTYVHTYIQVPNAALTFSLFRLRFLTPRHLTRQEKKLWSIKSCKLQPLCINFD